FNPSTYTEVKSRYSRLYDEGSADKPFGLRPQDRRKESIQFIQSQYSRFLSSEDKYAFDTIGFLLKTLGDDNEDKVKREIRQCLTVFLSYSSYIEWVNQNHKRVITKESAKLGFIEVLAGLFRQRAIERPIITIMTDLVSKGEPVKVRMSIIELLGKSPFSQAADILLGLLKDSDVNISKSALEALSKLDVWERIPELIKHLSVETRKEVQEQFSILLSETTGQRFGVDAAAWRKWWNTNPTPVISPNAVSISINKGVDYLIKSSRGSYSEDLVFYTLIKSGVPLSESVMNQYIETMLTKGLLNSPTKTVQSNYTYNVALMTMAFSELDSVKYLERIVQCTEFLLANQSVRGGWGYSVPDLTRFINIVPTGKPISPTPTTSSTRAIRKIPIKLPPRNKEGVWDTSISQYAVLGLRASADANIDIPAEVWRDAEKAFVSAQNSDGGWNCCHVGESVHTMVAGGLGSLAICLFYQNKDIKGNLNIKKAIEWLEKNFTIADPSDDIGKSYSPYYYLYALERAGTLLGIESFGKNQWYPLGARYLLSKQESNGSWGGDINTCFAILFLRRATKPFKIEITPGGGKK
ncbi:MAG: HEAT repeat domain-containing protein, partial [Planctomycetota bacterium]|nr:HEAT repeat domain-containing protein [Planctomycetota bacterium]